MLYDMQVSDMDYELLDKNERAAIIQKIMK